MSLLETKNLTKEYSPGKGAFDINIKINPGEIVGFIGPNGAGKSTTMRMIMNLTYPDKGEVFMFDKKILTEADKVNTLENVGFLPPEEGLYQDLTATKLIKYAKGFYKRTKSSELEKLIKDLNVDLDVKIKNLSSGNKKKVGLIISMINDPKLLILDEPTSGLDPLIQHTILKAIKAIKDNGNSVFLSSHNLFEVQSICDRIYMIKDGKIIFEGNTKEILKKALKLVRVYNLTKEQQENISTLKDVEKVKMIDGETIFYTHDQNIIIKYLIENNISEFYIERPTLEEMFIDLY